MKNSIGLTKKITIASAVLLLSLQASAEETVCSGALGNAQVDNLLVPSNRQCTLDGTRIMGNIVVQTNATLIARKIDVDGNVQAENASQVNILEESRIGGSVQLKQGGGATISDSIIASDVQFESNDRPFRALRNIIGGNLQVFQNIGGADIQFNAIDGNLQCKENLPEPTGGANRVNGNKEDQCERLTVPVSITDQQNCSLSNPKFDFRSQLFIPRLSAALPDGTVVDFWANLQFKPELSENGSLIFELRNSASELGRCN